VTPSAALIAALDDRSLPAALVDLDAFDANVATLAAASEPLPVRLATKSIRCQALLRRAADALGERFGGLMAVSPREALHLAEHGWRDLLIAYPVARPADARPLLTLAERGVQAGIIVDCDAHLELLDELAVKAGVELPVVLEVDASWRPLPGVHLGVRRSPVRSVQDALFLAGAVDARPGLRLTGVMIYEAQIAGVSDQGGAPVRLMKSRFRAHVRSLREQVVHALRQAGHHVQLVNGGGTGSVGFTASDPVCTELTVGSGLLAPHLFDAYRDLDLHPAAFAALPVTRRSDPDLVTVHGGGYPASGAVGADRLPRVHAPPGLAPTRLEGFGEVQSPLRGEGAPRLHPGDVVLVRHAKAGELFERFGQVHLVRQDAVLETVPTWRGEGLDLG